MTPDTLTKIRKAEGDSISSFCKRLGISRNTLGGYEAGNKPIPPYIALAVTAIYRRLEVVEL
jgi:transcriptional regulator with XRE-family HTH domain